MSPTATLIGWLVLDGSPGQIRTADQLINSFCDYFKGHCRSYKSSHGFFKDSLMKRDVTVLRRKSVILTTVLKSNRMELGLEKTIIIW